MRLAVIETDDERRFYLLRPLRLQGPDACDGCGRGRSRGFSVIHVSLRDGKNWIAGWACCVDCARNVVMAEES